MSERPRRVHILIEGRVQGVGFRAFVERVATGLGLGGYVRNRRDGAVEAELSGPAPLVEQAIARCRIGPRGARVDRLEVIARQEIAEGKGSHAGFTVQPTV